MHIFLIHLGKYNQASVLADMEKECLEWPSLMKAASPCCNPSVLGMALHPPFSAAFGVLGNLHLSFVKECF